MLTGGSTGWSFVADLSFGFILLGISELLDLNLSGLSLKNCLRGVSPRMVKGNGDRKNVSPCLRFVVALIVSFFGMKGHSLLSDVHHALDPASW